MRLRYGIMLCSPAPASAFMAQPKMREMRAISREMCDDLAMVQEPIKPVIRKEFPETWIWVTMHNTEDSIVSIRKKKPDSLTIWILAGFSIDPLSGLALTKKPCELLVQQQFHISLNLPYSVKRGEILTIPCPVFNYLPNYYRCGHHHGK